MKSDVKKQINIYKHYDTHQNRGDIIATSLSPVVLSDGAPFVVFCYKLYRQFYIVGKIYLTLLSQRNMYRHPIFFHPLDFYIFLQLTILQSVGIKSIISSVAASSISSIVRLTRSLVISSIRSTAGSILPSFA